LGHGNFTGGGGIRDGSNKPDAPTSSDNSSFFANGWIFSHTIKN
ncbi:unnamed protein product, partial [marine sediment metagenome]